MENNQSIKWYSENFTNQIGKVGKTECTKIDESLESSVLSELSPNQIFAIPFVLEFSS